MSELQRILDGKKSQSEENISDADGGHSVRIYARYEEVGKDSLDVRRKVEGRRGEDGH